MEPTLYLDCHATTPCDPRVVEAMLPVFSSVFANAASRQHAPGRHAAALVETAREQVAALLGCRPPEICFTSGATESDNLAIRGVAGARRGGRGHVITSTIEHRAVLDSCDRLEREGLRVTYLEVGWDGRVRPEDVERAFAEDTALVSVMYANNEIGTVQPVGEIGARCRRRGVPFHCDAAQALPYLPCDVDELGIDLLSISAHKMYGPKGVGALFVRGRRPRVRLLPLLEGGGHERGLRSGTLNVPGIVGLGAACELVREARRREADTVRALRDRLLDRLLAAIPGTVVNGCLEHRLPNNLNLSFAGVEAASLLRQLRRVAASSGSACSSARDDGSYVLRTLGRRDGGAAPDGVDAGERARSSIRLGLGRFTTAAEVDAAAAEIAAAVHGLRAAARPGAADACEASCDP